MQALNTMLSLSLTVHKFLQQIRSSYAVILFQMMILTILRQDALRVHALDSNPPELESPPLSRSEVTR